VHELVINILTDNGMDKRRAALISDALTSGRWTHDYPISIEQAGKLGMPVSSDLPEEVTELMQLYPQGAGRRPSVQYIPVPYRREEPPQPARRREK